MGNYRLFFVRGWEGDGGMGGGRRQESVENAAAMSSGYGAEALTLKL